MKKRWFFPFLLLAGILGATCISCNPDNDSEWRDANIAFMSKIAKKSGILTIRDSVNGVSGIYYEILETGDPTSMTPIIGDVVKLDYTGWLYNSSESFVSGSDYSQQLGKNLVSGWTVALEKMHIGDEWKLYIPYYLGYGITTYDKVPAYSALIYTLKLKEITTSRR